MTHICVCNLTMIGSDNGLSPDGRQAIIWTNAGILLTGLTNKLQWNLNRTSYIFIQENAFEIFVCEMASILSRPQCVNDWNFAILLPIKEAIELKHYTPRIMHTLQCYGLVHVHYTHILQGSSLAPSLSYDCHSASEATQRIHLRLNVVISTKLSSLTALNVV